MQFTSKTPQFYWSDVQGWMKYWSMFWLEWFLGDHCPLIIPNKALFSAGGGVALGGALRLSWYYHDFHGSNPVMGYQNWLASSSGWWRANPGACPCGYIGVFKTRIMKRNPFWGYQTWCQCCWDTWRDWIWSYPPRFPSRWNINARQKPRKRVMFDHPPCRLEGRELSHELPTEPCTPNLCKQSYHIRGTTTSR